MCSRGRILRYVKTMLGDAPHNLLLVGYQAEGTSGRQIRLLGPKGFLEMDGQRYAIKAQVHTISGYSVQTDQWVGRFVTRMRHWPSEVRIVHGSPQSSKL
ncbi:hypothetical protein N7333_11310 [Pseudomonas sp. GD04158]|nr:hypothetical protein [Pseudomonas sp. GD04158]MDH0097161.1 hypothetical protein [Pseudomonas sp. GD04158]